MSFECNNGVCYIKNGSGFNSNVAGDFPLPKKTTIWTVYGRSSCPFCVKIRHFFDGIGIKYVYYDIERIPRGKDIKHIMGGLTNGYDKVPMVFFYGMFIGGYNETMKYIGVNN